MKKIIDHLNDVTGWTISAPSAIKLNQSSKYVAGYNSASVQIDFDSADVTKSAELILPAAIDVSEYETLVFSIKSYDKGRSGGYIRVADFAYKIQLNNQDEYLIPVGDQFSSVDIGIEDVTEITKIKITALHQGSDTIIISEMVAEHDEMLLDVNTSVKEALENYLQTRIGDKYYVGNVTANIGDITILIDNPAYVDRYAVIKIDDGLNQEIHQVTEANGQVFKLDSEIENTYVGASVYLQFSVTVGNFQNEIQLPGITVWGIEPERILRTGKLDTIRDTWRPTGESSQRVEGQLYNLTIMMTCQARGHEHLEIMAKACRWLCGSEKLWVNGRAMDIDFGGPGQEYDLSSEGIDHMPQITYTLQMVYYEELNERETVPATVSISIDTEIQ